MQDERLERDLGGAPYLGAGEGGVRPVRGAEACRQRAGTAGRWVGGESLLCRGNSTESRLGVFWRPLLQL